MITMTVFRSDTGIYQGFLCSGHAGFARAGRDIVCAAVSVLVINTVNSIEQFGSGQAFDCKQEKGQHSSTGAYRGTHKRNQTFAGFHDFRTAGNGTGLSEKVCNSKI